MTYRGNEASYRNGSAASRARRRRMLAGAIRPVLESLESRQYLSVNLTNQVGQTGVEIDMPLEFNRGDSLPANSYDVDVYWEWDETLQGDGSHDHLSVETPDQGQGEADLTHTYYGAGDYEVHVHVSGPTDPADASQRWMSGELATCL